MKKFAVSLMIVSLACFAAESGSARDMVQVKGSDTLINAVQRLSEVYMEKNPGKVIAVTGGGSGTGIAAMVNGKCDIANASRAIKPKEVEMAVQRGIAPKNIVVAIDGLCVIVNKANPVKQLTVDQVGKIYRGEITNWKELGGADTKISLYGRQPNSGTYDFMKEVVMKAEYAPAMREMNGNAQIVEAVKQDAGAVGYVGVGYVKEAGESIQVINVARFAGGEYTTPLNAEDVKSGKYPISRPLYQYVNGVPKGDVRGFIEFELGPEGQKIVEEEGFFAVSKEYVEYNQKQMM